MFLADDDPIKSEALEKETMLSYYALLNTKLIKLIKAQPRQKNKRGSKSSHSNRV